MNLLVQQVLAIAEKAHSDATARPGETREIIEAARSQVSAKILETDNLEGGQYERPLRDFCGSTLGFLGTRERSQDGRDCNSSLYALQQRAEKL